MRNIYKILSSILSFIAVFLGLYYQGYLEILEFYIAGYTINQWIFLLLSAVFIGMLISTVFSGGLNASSISEFNEWMERLPGYEKTKKGAIKKFKSKLGLGKRDYTNIHVSSIFSREYNSNEADLPTPKQLETGLKRIFYHSIEVVSATTTSAIESLEIYSPKEIEIPAENIYTKQDGKKWDWIFFIILIISIGTIIYYMFFK
ncbi:MAG: hypothetical protein ACTSVC_05470 [Promethearchaeota archaeon]